jgi:uncharacterized phage protein gp47/JayE
MANRYGPTIDANGIHADDFATTLDKLKADIQSIFGADVYLGNDSQDGQFVAIVAQAITDCNAGCVAAYNAFSPTTAQGNGLSSVVKINGLARNVPSNSTCDLTIVGVAGTAITNGQATDTNGNTWNLPASVTIPNAGTITATSTCATPGAISAGAGTITKIKTPVFGWQTVSNVGAAVLGSPVETDAALRSRQGQSVAGPSLTVFEGVMASIASILGVTRSRGYENNTNATDGNGVLAHSCSIFVEGGDQTTILQTIARKMTPGTGLNGSINTTYIDATGSSRVVKFSRPTNAVIHVALTVKALSGWSTSVEPLIAQAVVDYINGLPVGDNVHYFDVSAIARIVGSPYASTFSLQAITLAKNAGSPAASDVTIAYNEVPTGDVANVGFTVT